MLWALDEVTQTCPLPLPSLLADAGGRGIQIMPVVHGAAQLRSPVGPGRGTRHPGHRQRQGVPARHVSDPETLELGQQAVRHHGRPRTRPANTTPGTR